VLKVDADEEGIGGDDASTTSDATVTDAGTIFDATPIIDAAPMIDAAPVLCAAQGVTVLTDISNNAEVDQVTVDDSWVYYHDNNGVWRVSKSGGMGTLLAPGKAPSWPDLGAFALSDNGITWWQILNGQMKTDVKRVPKSGGATTIVTTLPDYFFYGAGGPAGGSFIWNGKVLDSVSAGGVQKQVGGAAFLSAVSYVDGELYTLAQTSLYHWDGMTFQTLAMANNGYLELMAFDATTIFLAGSDGNGGFGVSSVPRSGGALTSIFAVPLAYMGGLAVDADHVYVANRIPGNNMPSSLMRMDKDGANLTTIGQAPSSQIVGVAVDDLCIYWTETTNTGKTPSRVMAAPK